MIRDREAFRIQWLENMRGLLREPGKTEEQINDEAEYLWREANRIADEHKARVAKARDQ